MDPPKQIKQTKQYKHLETNRNKQKQTETNRYKQKQTKQTSKTSRKENEKTNSQLPKSNDDYNVHNCF